MERVQKRSVTADVRIKGTFAKSCDKKVIDKTKRKNSKTKGQSQMLNTQESQDERRKLRRSL